MTLRMTRGLLLSGLFVLFSLLVSPEAGGVRDTGPIMPQLVLWAWERPEDLLFLQGQGVGVGYLAGSLRLNGDACTFRPRMQPLLVPSDATLIVVLRVESDRRDPPRLTSEQESGFVNAVLALAKEPGIHGIQIDFDAASSQREFYCRVLHRVRSGLPDGVSLSITALASWCTGDRWLARLPVDEVVVMMFRMGLEGEKIRRRNLQSLDSGCSILSTGVSLDEQVSLPPKSCRVFCFSPWQWTPGRYRSMMRKVAHASEP